MPPATINQGRYIMPTGHYDRTTVKPKRRKTESEESYNSRLETWMRMQGFVPVSELHKAQQAIKETIQVVQPVQHITTSTETALAEHISDDILERYSTQEDITLFWDLVRSITAYKMKKRGLVASSTAK